MRYSKIIGIDPGATGAIAILSKSGIGVKPMPRIKELQELLREQAEYVPICFVEFVSAWTGDTDPKAKDYNPGKQFGIQKLKVNYTEIISSLTYIGIDYVVVHPKTWQAYLKLNFKGKSKPYRKKKYKEAAAIYWPGATNTLWSADALCIVQFGRLKLLNDMEYINEKLIRGLTKKEIFT